MFWAALTMSLILGVLLVLLAWLLGLRLSGVATEASAARRVVMTVEARSRHEVAAAAVAVVA